MPGTSAVWRSTVTSAWEGTPHLSAGEREVCERSPRIELCKGVTNGACSASRHGGGGAHVGATLHKRVARTPDVDLRAVAAHHTHAVVLVAVEHGLGEPELLARADPLDCGDIGSLLRPFCEDVDVVQPERGGLQTLGAQPVLAHEQHALPGCKGHGGARKVGRHRARTVTLQKSSMFGNGACLERHSVWMAEPAGFGGQARRRQRKPCCRRLRRAEGAQRTRKDLVVDVTASR